MQLAPHDNPALTFLTLCTHRQIQPEQLNPLLETGIDADAVYQLAHRHNLTMILYRGLLQIGQPVELMERLKTELAEQAVFYEFVYPQQIATILEALHDRHIDTLLLKGHALGQCIYQQPVMRPYDDFDILIPADRLDSAVQVITALGYYPDEDIPDYHLNHHHLVPYIHPEWLPVELHWRLVTPLGATQIDMNTVWAKAERWQINDVTTYGLATEHQIIYLALHAVSGHLFDIGLKALCDIQEVIVNSTPDWATVITTCHEWRCARQVVLALSVVNVFYADIVPEAILKQLSSQPIDQQLLTYSIRNVVATAITGLEDSSGLAQMWQENDLTHRIQLALERLFPSPQTISKTYQVQGIQRWLYYPHWQANLLKRHLGTMLNLLRADPETVESARQEARRRALLDWVSKE